ncbi:hypothetical protein MSKU9_0690 [Komagataeibacter diospyri]|uniref:Uncharacterized protein n=2 Tax=Komagataeibacter diospyri TaxID=1932662 RepID=A0A4P5NM59_9PROT|nr:hypothetical protein MSKU9_0690 [Komagataeibacter diospyri]
MNMEIGNPSSTEGCRFFHGACRSGAKLLGKEINAVYSPFHAANQFAVISPYPTCRAADAMKAPAIGRAITGIFQGGRALFCHRMAKMHHIDCGMLLIT